MDWTKLERLSSHTEIEAEAEMRASKGQGKRTEGQKWQAERNASRSRGSGDLTAYPCARSPARDASARVRVS